jgi:DNA-binding NarL/FixJ family response regulator
VKVLLAVESSDLRLALDLFLREQPGALVVGAACTAEGAMALLRTVEVDLVVLQWSLPGLPVTELLAEGHTLCQRPHFLILGTRAADERPAIVAGADTFALLGDSPQKLLNAIESLMPPPAEIPLG